MKPTILLVDDEPFVLNTLTRFLKRNGYNVHKALGGEAALAVFESSEVTVMVTDYRMPDINGAELLQRVSAISPDTVNIVLSGQADLQVVIGLLNSGHAYKFMQKPWVEDELLNLVDEACSEHHARVQRRLGATQSTTDTDALAGAFQDAIGTAEMSVRLQPKVSVESNQVCGVEALARWNSQAMGREVRPDEFIAIAEQYGHIIEFGRWLIKECCRIASELKREMRTILPIAINISGVQISDDPDWIEFLLEQLVQHQLTPEWIQIEITETVAVKHLKDCVAQLTKLANAGVHVWLDDFGAGTTSVSYLRQLRLHGVKLDKSLIDEVENEWRAANIVWHLINMLHDLDVVVVAEGVEREGQLELLRGWQCEYIQGYLFYKPLLTDELIDKLSKPLNEGVTACNH